MICRIDQPDKRHRCEYILRMSGAGVAVRLVPIISRPYRRVVFFLDVLFWTQAGCGVRTVVLAVPPSRR